ncbi:unnamed protein product [Urochloa humidicola]
MESLEVWYTINSCYEDRVTEFMFPNLRVLQIVACPNLRLEPCPHRAEEQWEILSSDGVLSTWEEGSSRTSASSPSSAPVSTLHVNYCNVPMRQWRLLHHLPALTILKIQGRCSDLSSSPEIVQTLSSIQSLTLDHGMEESPEPELPNWLGQLASLKKLTIRSYEVKALQDSMGHLTRLQELCVDDIESMTTLPRWVGNLISVQQLKISSCPNLNDLTEHIGRLTSLNILEINCCNGITSLPESTWGLTSLNKLKIHYCNGITSLPESIGGLTSLNKLKILYCSGITSLPECIGGLTSLKKLKICGCNGITSLPASIKQLTKLEELNIYDCNELQKWCNVKKNKMKLAHIKVKVLTQ